MAAFENQFSEDVKTPPGVFSFPCVAEPDTEGQNASDCYKVTMLSDKTYDAKPMFAAINALTQRVWGLDWKEVEHPFKDGDKTADKLGHAGCLVYTLKKTGFDKKTKEKKKAPRIVGPNWREGSIPAEEIYGGAEGQCVFVGMAYERTDQKTKQVIRGISLRLKAVQKLRDGERFGGGGSGVHLLDDVSEADSGGLSVLDDAAPAPATTTPADEYGDL